MGIKSYGDYGNNSGLLVTKILGNSYDVIKQVYMNLPEIIITANNIEMLYALNKAFDKVNLMASKVIELELRVKELEDKLTGTTEEDEEGENE